MMADTKNTCFSPEAIRIECLRLANIPGRDTKLIVERAKEFERFVVGPVSEQTAATPTTTDKATAKPRSKSS
ncbi:hypothetical protein [Pandoraea apista]|uniref:Uncharacterized protein n=1 Tax=Pandoraea apista TaxID=93218 RepID=A0ABX9ZHV6_9BURK|nr:hypothetical protein [Pandoraea apista]PTE02702.1 hypothetical protein C7830_00305 [Pandoraea apista]RRJ26336.1 hypothetical protein EIB05_23380 [Pandoraea apista]RRJ72903.1 hypothetical protein EIL82_23355 [Pandoraea apista]RSC97856.1 hypothetical protein EJB12_23905 [Pandoraea apista]RSD08295.1 hypothetical protein EIZ52_24635 [Pandoraea apista]